VINSPPNTVLYDLRDYQITQKTKLKNLFNRFDHLLNDLLRITKDHHGFIHIEEFVI